MKKQIKKLSLNKKTISNLSTLDLKRQIGGAGTQKDTCGGCSGYCSENCSYGCTAFTCLCTVTCKGHTCKGNNC